MKRKWLKSLLAVAMVICLTACSAEKTPSGPKWDTETKEREENKEMKETKEENKKPSEPAMEVTAMSMPSFVTEDRVYQPLDFIPHAPDYKIASDLSNIANLDQFSNLTSYQRDMIAKNGFVVIPSNSEQIFYIYEDNTYKLIPNFITVDSVLQLYHIYYDYSLRKVENNFFYDKTKDMNVALLSTSIAEYQGIKDERVKDAMKRVMAYYATVDLLLDVPLPESLEKDVAELARAEYELVKRADTTTISPITGAMTDYTLFTVRGHYTRTEELKKYFLAFSYYGIAAFNFYDKGEKKEDNALCAMLLADTLKDTPFAEEIWNTIYATTSFMVGESDDLMPCEVADLLVQIYGHVPTPDELPEKMDQFYRGLEALRGAEIVNKQAAMNKEKQMRFMGQRYIPDSEILQELSDPDFRPYPAGLDVFAVFGSKRAEELLHQIYRPNELWPEYQEHFDEMANKFRNQSIKEQTGNAYTGWLFTLNEVAAQKGAGYPLFMRNDAWMNKSVTTALGSWSELRHDTILYGKQSGAECGGGEEPPEVMGYVEPDPEFFHRLIWLTETTRDGLEERGVLSDEMRYKTETMLYMLNFLETCALKELSGEELTAEEHYTILVYGGTLEYITSSIAEADGWYMVESDTDRNMAVIADVHTTLAGYLEEGVGHAAEIYVAVPQNGKVYLTRGAVFDYFEFESNIRLTDEEWQRIINVNPPERVPYVGTFMDENGGSPTPLPDTPYTTGC